MLNKINTLLASAAQPTIEFKTTAYNFVSPDTPDTTSTVTLPAEIKQGSLGLLLVSASRGNSTNTNDITLGTPTGFTLINKIENAGSTGRGASQGLFYKYMTTADSSTVISTIYSNNRGEVGEVVFIEVIPKNITVQNFNSLTNLVSVFGTNPLIATLTDVPSNISTNSQFFILTCALSGGGGGLASSVLTGGMELYDTSQIILSTGDLTRSLTTLWKYDNILIKDLPTTADAIYSVDGGGHLSSGVYAIWMK